MELSFTGQRYTNKSQKYPEIELVTIDGSKPQFRYSNDSEIYFGNLSNMWKAAPTPFPSFTGSSSIGGPTSLIRTSSAGKPANTGGAYRLESLNTGLSYILALGGSLVF